MELQKYNYFKPLKEEPLLFNSVMADQGRHGIIWNDEIDISSNELWTNGKKIDTPFEGLMALSDATSL